MEKVQDPYWFLFMIALLVSSCQPARYTSQSAIKKGMKKALPEIGELCFSSRWKHPASSADTLDTFAAAAEFDVNRIDWVYSREVDWIKECKARGFVFGGALSPTCPDDTRAQTRVKGRIVLEDGTLFKPPWMESWGEWYWGCVNNPIFRKTFLDHAKIYVDGGSDYIIIDDPHINLRAPKGCFCQYCKKIATERGASNVVDIQESSIREFYAWFRKELNTYARRFVPMACNNFNGSWDFPYNLFDFGIAELKEKNANPTWITESLMNSQKLGKRQVFTLVSDDPILYNKVYTLVSVLGGNMIAPWDVYIGENGARNSRYFGNYGDMQKNTDYIKSMDLSKSWVIDRIVQNNSEVDLELSKGEILIVKKSPGDKLNYYKMKWGNEEYPKVNLDKKNNLSKSINRLTVYNHKYQTKQ